MIRIAIPSTKVHFDGLLSAERTDVVFGGVGDFGASGAPITWKSIVADASFRIVVRSLTAFCPPYLGSPLVGADFGGSTDPPMTGGPLSCLKGASNGGGLSVTLGLTDCSCPTCDPGMSCSANFLCTCNNGANAPLCQLAAI